MGIFKWIRDRSERSRPFGRWSSDELAERKHYLEAKAPDEFTREDYKLLIEWLFQRYLPSDYVMTEAAWSEKMKAIMARVDLNVERSKSLPHRPWIPPPRPPKYELSRDDFQTIIVPCLLRFSFFPEVSTLDWHGGSFGEAYWLIASNVYRDQSEGRSRITGKCDDFAIALVIREHCRSFEQIMNARLIGRTMVRISADPKQCPACRSKADYTEEIAVLLDSFRRGCPPFPHEVIAEDSSDWCRSPIIVPAPDTPTRDDIEFHERLLIGVGNPDNLGHYIKADAAGHGMLD